MQATFVPNSKWKYSDVDIGPEAVEKLSHISFPG